MNPVVAYLIQRPGLLAGMLPVLLVACIWAIRYWLRGRRVDLLFSEQNGFPPLESDWFSPTESLPYYCSTDIKPSLSIPERLRGFLSRIGFWAVHYWITHFAVMGVGAVAIGGIAACSIFSRMKFANVWMVLGGIGLFLVYLAFVGVAIILINSICLWVLQWVSKQKEQA